jgi:hypothetical protein
MLIKVETLIIIFQRMCYSMCLVIEFGFLDFLFTIIFLKIKKEADLLRGNMVA